MLVIRVLTVKLSDAEKMVGQFMSAEYQNSFHGNSESQKSSEAPNYREYSTVQQIKISIRKYIC